MFCALSLGSAKQRQGWCAVSGQPRSAIRDQYAVKLESLILTEERDLELLTWERPRGPSASAVSTKNAWPVIGLPAMPPVAY
jgi:hypothetical protein